MSLVETPRGLRLEGFSHLLSRQLSRTLGPCQFDPNKRSHKRSGKRSITLGSVVDNTEKYRFQAARLLLSLRNYGGAIADAPFHLVSTSALPKNFEDFFKDHGATLHMCRPFDTRKGADQHTPLNKLRLFDVPELANYDQIVLLDCDTLIVQDPSSYLFNNGIGAKLADVPSVREADLLEAFQHLGVRQPAKEVYAYELAKAKTIGYFNAGLISITRPWLKLFTDRWNALSRKLLMDQESLAFPNFHTDQVALAASIIDLKIPMSELPAAINFPVHFERTAYPSNYDEIDPVIIHYHGKTDRNQLIAPLPLKGAWERAQRFNELARKEIRALLSG